MAKHAQAIRRKFLWEWRLKEYSDDNWENAHKKIGISGIKWLKIFFSISSSLYFRFL